MEFVLVFALLYYLALRAFYRRQVRQERWVKQTVTPVPPPYDDTAPIRLDQVLAWLPPSIADDFTCANGPHEWRGAEVNIIGLEGVHQFCLHCPAHRRLREAA